MKIYTQPRSLQSDWARRNDTFIAAAASIGYITNLAPDGYIGRQWRITSMGLKYLEK